MSPVTSIGDPRVQPQAYVHDGERLYQVLDVFQTRVLGPPVRKVVLEDASDGCLLELTERQVLARMTLVKPARTVR